MKTAGGYVNRPGGPTEGAPHCPRCGSSVLTPTDEDQYYNEFKCDLCGYVFPSDESDPYEHARHTWEPHPTKAPGRWDGVTHPATKTASARDMVPEQTLAQIGRMNLMAISGFRWSMDSNGDMLLPISSGYRVRISLDANDTYTVTREMKRGDKIFVKGTQSDVYAEDLGETCYQASSYKSNDWGGHTVGSKKRAWIDTSPAGDYDNYTPSYDDGWNTDFGPFGDEPDGGSDDMDPFDVTLVCDQCGAEVSTTITWAGQEVYCPNGHGRMWKTKETTAMTHPHREAQLLEALEYATPREAVRITAELDGLRHAARQRREAGHAIDWDAVKSGVPGGPVPPGLHTASTDWMADREPVATPDKVRKAARSEAERWLLHADPIVLRHPEELEKQALDHAEVWSTRFPNSNLAHRSFVSSLTELLGISLPQRQAADDEGVADIGVTCSKCGESIARDEDGVWVDDVGSNECDEGGVHTSGDSKESSRKTAATCACAHNSDGTVTTMLCPVHASEDPCATMAAVTGGRRRGAIVKGVCTNCGWSEGGDSKESRFRRVIARTAATGSELRAQHSDLFSGADAAYDAEDSSWFESLSMDDLLILWDSVSGNNFIDMEGPWDDEVYEALADKGYEFPVKESRRRTAAATAECPSCGGPAEVWADNSDVDSSGAAITVNFACDNPKCKSGKGPWDTPRPGSHTSRRRTAASPDLREIERWCDTMGLVMKDFPDSMITRAAETGSTAELEAWIETNEPLTQGMWDEEPAPYSSYDNSPIGYYD